jgi:hypothetical protein
MYKPTWSGWTVEAFYGWGRFMKLAIPGLFMVSLDYFVYEVGIILAGRWPKEDMHLKNIISIYFFLQNFHRGGKYFPPRW